MASNMDLAKGVRKEMIKLLNDRLVELVDLGTHMKEAHWNVRGPAFIAVHEFLDEAGDEVAEAVDEIAERAVQLGGRASGLASLVAEFSELPAYPNGLVDQADHLKAIARSVGWCGARLRAAIDTADKAGDAATADLFTQHTRAFDTLLWKIESHLG